MRMNDQIIALLSAKGLLDQKTIGVAKDLLSRGKTLEQILVGGRFVNDVDFATARAEVLGLPFMDLSDWKPQENMVDFISQEVIDEYHLLPVSLEGDVLTVALLDPQDLRAEQALEFLASGRGIRLRPVVAPSGQLRKILKLGSGLGTEVQSALQSVEASKDSKKDVAAAQESKNLQEVIKGAPVARMLTTVMRNAVEQNASDIHIESVGGESRVRYRIDGVLRTVLTLPLTIHPALVARIKVLANLKLDETRVPQDGRISQSFGGKKIDFRISTLPIVDNEKVVMRILDTSVGAPTLERLGYRKEHTDLVHEEIKKSHGLLLVTGPTGSGKSTTLFACLNLLNNEGVNISTLEDPVEYYIQGVNQSQIRPEIGYTFAAGLRSLLRQDPNVIMVGEIRDKETAELAIHASLTGHLVLSTLHTNDVFGLVPRLLDMGVEPYLLAATLNLGVAQRLARKLCEFCRQPDQLDPEILRRVTEEVKRIPKRYFSKEPDWTKPLPFTKTVGCERCNHTGYIGRVAIAELFQFNDHARILVQEGFKPNDVNEEAKRQEMITLRQDGLLKALDGLTSIGEIFRVSQETSEDEMDDKQKEKEKDKEKEKKPAA
jgi:type IV pilus assembly protein PilB